MIINKKLTIFSIMLGLLTLPSAFKLTKVFADENTNENNSPKPIRTCYMPVRIPDNEQSLKQHEASLQTLEEIYKSGNINEETYKTRKEELLKKIEECRQKEDNK